MAPAGAARVETVTSRRATGVEAIASIALLRSELIGRRITVEVDLATDLPATSGDSVQLQQVLLNLVVNAPALAFLEQAAEPVNDLTGSIVLVNDIL
jgi:signal transduction histidine kinase